MTRPFNALNTAMKQPPIRYVIFALLILLPNSAIYAKTPAPDARTAAHTVDTSPAEVEAIRIGLTPGRTRLVFDVSQATDFALESNATGKSHVITLASANTQFDHKRVPLVGSGLRSITVHSDQRGLTYRIETDKALSTKRIFLPPNDIHGYRLVVDFHDDSQVTRAVTTQATTADAASKRENESLPQTATRNYSSASATTLPNPIYPETEGQLSGYLSVESRLFARSPLYSKQDRHNISIAVEPEYFYDWDDARSRLAVRAFMRYDANDDERTHVDLRELYWRLERDRWVFKAGIDVVFWGVTESKHLVDIINQTDLVENIDGEDKLGQPMVSVEYASGKWGTWQAYVLPYFRERTYPGTRGRLRSEPYVDTDDPQYQSGDDEKHIDFAVRWSHYVGDWDFGIAHFSGTERTPYLLPTASGSDVRLRPHYLQIDQTSLDVQATMGAWLWKLEAVYNDNHFEDYFASSAGFEFTQFGVLDSSVDLGWLLEYHFDERDERSQSVLQKDVFAGVRYTGNDIASTRLLAGLSVDVDTEAIFTNIEAVRRLGEHWTLTLEARFFSNTERPDALHFLRRDDYVELQFTRYF